MTSSPLANYSNQFPVPSQENEKAMWDLASELFPRYRSLCGPGFAESLGIIGKYENLQVAKFDTGKDVLGWTIPPEFKVNAAWVEDPSGKRVIDFTEHPYSVWIYSQPFDGVVEYDELIQHLATLPYLPDAIPLRQSYYRNNWGVCTTHDRFQTFEKGRYRVHIDTELSAGYLRIGEAFLKGGTNQEILLNSYLCHPYGANDNLSGVVVAIELFKMLKQLPRRRFSYRLALWPESIGPITYISEYPERVKNTIGGFQFGICGDSAPIRLDETFFGNSIFDRAVRHAMKVLNLPVRSRPFSHFDGSSDAAHFNSVGLRIPMAMIARGGPTPQGYLQYHSSADDMSIISPQNLRETLDVVWTALMAIERNEIPEATYTVTPFLSRYGIFPYHHGSGSGAHGNMIAKAYFELIHAADGKQDLLAIADRFDLPIFAFDEPVSEFRRVGLLK